MVDGGSLIRPSIIHYESVQILLSSKLGMENSSSVTSYIAADMWVVNSTIPAKSLGPTPSATSGNFSGPYPSGYSWVHIILASIIVTLIMILIVIGNALVIIATAVDRNLTGVQNWFIASLAVSDLLVGLLIMPLTLANELMGYWFFGQILCELWLATDVLFSTASILNLCLISLDRYWSITRAVSYVRQRTKKRAVIMITVVWILSMIICFPPLAGWKRPQPTRFGLPLCVLSEDIGYIVYSTMGSFYIPGIIMVFVYLKIYLAARKRARRGLKKKKVLPENGKSSTTTTSFSSKLGETKVDLEDTSELCSEELPDNSSNKAVIEPAVSPPSSKLPTALHVKSTEENKRLLSEDTDSAHEAPPARGNLQNKAVQTSDETDTASGLNEEKSDSNIKLGPSDDSADCVSGSQTKITIKTPGGNRSDKVENKKRKNMFTKKSKGHSGPRRIKVKFLSPSDIRRFSNNIVRSHDSSFDEKQNKKPFEDPEKQKRKLARAKERRATLVLGIIMATFILCWMPFFSIYLISSIFKLYVDPMIFAVCFWLGYCNSALNPLIYTIFNRDFRHAFQKLLCGIREYRR